MGKMSLSKKLVILFLVAGILPAAIIAGILLYSTSKDMKDHKKVTFGTLNAVMNVKKKQLENFFSEREGDMKVLAALVGKMKERAYAKDGDKEDFLSYYCKTYGYYDLFLIKPEGYIYYTVCHEPDYQTNIINGKYQDSNFGELIRRVKQTEKYGFVDFKPYAPSNGAPAAFIAQPVIKDGKTEVIVALQIPLEPINAIMGVRAGMGKSGESYLVGPDYRMRSDSYLDKEGRSVVASFKGTVEDNGCKTVASEAALAGNTGADIIIDYNGNPVLSAYTPVKVGDTTWALLAEVDEAEAYSGLHTLRFIVAVVGGAFIVLILVVAILFSRSITKPVHNIIEGLRSGADQVASASNQVSSSGQSLAQGASEQASSLEEISSSLEEMASMTSQNADNATQADGLAKEAQIGAEKCSSAMNNMQNAIDRIKDSSEETAKIIKTIDEIAFQTNLLALNAAVEAARAGEAGKGFAVVAEEVRNLAQRSAVAAKDTSELIEEAQNNAKNGVAASIEVSEILQEIVDASAKVAGLINEVSAASSEQSQGIGQINTAISQMDNVTQSNAASAEESAAASEELSAQSADLKDMVSRLVVLIDGYTSETAVVEHFVAAPQVAVSAPKRTALPQIGTGQAFLAR